MYMWVSDMYLTVFTLFKYRLFSYLVLPKKPDCYMYDTYIQTSIQVFGIRNLNFTFQSPISNLLYTFIQTKFITQPQILIE